MAETVRIPGNLEVAGRGTFGSMTVPANAVSDDSVRSDAGLQRTKFKQYDLDPFPIPLISWRVWDALHTNLPGTAATDDLALIGGTFATASPVIQAGDLKAAGATNRRARTMVQLPHNYVAGETILLRAHCGMVTTIADVSCTVDFEVFKSDGEAGIGSDLCTTAATTINSLTDADKDFTIDGSGLNPGDMLDIRMTVACNDAATATAVIPQVGSTKLLCDTKG